MLGHSSGSRVSSLLYSCSLLGLDTETGEKATPDSPTLPVRRAALTWESLLLPRHIGRPQGCRCWDWTAMLSPQHQPIQPPSLFSYQASATAAATAPQHFILTQTAHQGHRPLHPAPSAHLLLAGINLLHLAQSALGIGSTGIIIFSLIRYEWNVAENIDLIETSSKMHFVTSFPKSLL